MSRIRIYKIDTVNFQEMFSFLRMVSANGYIKYDNINESRIGPNNVLKRMTTPARRAMNVKLTTNFVVFPHGLITVFFALLIFWAGRFWYFFRSLLVL
jgi:hypothetical protein